MQKTALTIVDENNTKAFDQKWLNRAGRRIFTRFKQIDIQSRQFQLESDRKVTEHHRLKTYTAIMRKDHCNERVE